MKKQFFLSGIGVVILLILFFYLFSLNNNVPDTNLKPVNVSDAEKEFFLSSARLIESMKSGGGSSSNEYFISISCETGDKLHPRSLQEGRIYAMLGYISLHKIFKEKNMLDESRVYYAKFLDEYETFQLAIRSDSMFVYPYFYELVRIVEQIKSVNGDREIINYFDTLLVKHSKEIIPLFFYHNENEIAKKEEIMPLLQASLDENLDIQSHKAFPYEQPTFWQDYNLEDYPAYFDIYGSIIFEIQESLMVVEDYHNYSHKHNNLETLKTNLAHTYQTDEPLSCFYLLPDVALYRMTQNESYFSRLDSIVTNHSFSEYIYGVGTLDVDWRCGDILYKLGKKEHLKQLLLNEKNNVLVCSQTPAIFMERKPFYDPVISLRQVANFLYLYSKLEVDLT